MIPYLILLAGQSDRIVQLQTLDVSHIVQGWGKPGINHSVEGNPLTAAGKVYPLGLGTHAPGEIWIRLDGKAKRFTAMGAIDDEQKGQGSVRFQVVLDGKVAATSPVLKGDVNPYKFDVDLTGVKVLRLVVDDAGDGMNYDHADWLDPVITLGPGAAMPTILTLDSGPELPLAPVDRTTTRLNGARIIGGTPGRPFLFRIAASGARPMTFSARGLPAGLVLDRTTGIVTGSLIAPGETDVAVSVTGPGGTDSGKLHVSAGAHRLALTPPMGWNSWNIWGTSVTAERVRAAADSMQSSGLADFGYTYVNIDDAWESPLRDADGNIGVNDKFGDMKQFTDHVHSLGLKTGIYSSPGETTCGGYLGSLGHEQKDADTYAKWGIDYLKYDWCSYGNVAPHPDLEALQKPYKLMSKCLDNSGRDIVLSLCQYGMGDVWKWGPETGGQLWRTTGDITDNWGSMSEIGFAHSDRSPYVRAGAWNDPDMLVVGQLGWGNPHPSGLSHNEQITHITLWSMLAAPLLIGCDLTKMDDFTQRVLMNPETIDIDQDALAKAATRVSADNGLEVWSRPLSDGSVAVALFNRGIVTSDVKISAAALHLSPSLQIRNVWTRKDEGRLGDVLSRAIPGHGAILLKVHP